MDYQGGETLSANFSCAGIPKQPILDNQLFHLPYVNRPAKVTFTPNGGIFNSGDLISMSTLSTGANIYYTLNGSTPTSAAALYTAPISLNAETTIKAIALNTGSADGFVAEARFVSNTGVKTLKKNSFVLYPNPSVNGNFKLQMPAEFEGKNAVLKIYNAIGKIIHNETLKGISDYTFSGNNCSLPGIYLITLEADSNRKQVKLVVN